jgi:hypothetical protein
MRKCKWCGKSGWFLNISKEGLCQKCDPEVKARIMYASRIMNESLVMMRRAKNIETQLSRGQLAIEQLQEIIPYHNKGLVILRPSPQEMVARIHHQGRSIVNRHIEHLYKSALQEIQQTDDPATRVRLLDIVLAEIEKYDVQLGQSNTQNWRKKVESDKASLLVEKAEKDIGKGRRLAIDQYIEALDMLRTDDSTDPHNKRRIDKIKKRIRDLGGEVPQRWEASDKSGGVTGGDALPNG